MQTIKIFRRNSPLKSSAEMNGKKIKLADAYRLVQKDYKLVLQVTWPYGIDIYYKK
jgi:hypothetical protein